MGAVKALLIAVREFGFKAALGYLLLATAVLGIGYIIWIICEQEEDGKKLSKEEVKKKGIEYIIGVIIAAAVGLLLLR